MDVVYTYRDDPRTGNKQLKYSLRSVEKHLSGVGEVYVIGANPNLAGVIHLEHKDDLSAAKNIMSKLQVIARTEAVSEDFLYIADDHYLMKDNEAKLYPYYVSGTLQELVRTQNNSYGAMVKNTIKALQSKGFATNNYNVHCPIIYNKTRLRQLAEIYDLSNPLNYILKSLYCNTFPVEGAIQLKDCKIRTNFSIEEMRSRISGRDCWSSGKEWVCPNIGVLLNELFPLKSKYE